MNELVKEEIKIDTTFIDIFTKMNEICKKNEELSFFFEGYIECLLNGINAMYWNIENDDNLVIINNFFKKLYQNNPTLYQINKWPASNDRKEYEIIWFYSLEEQELFNRKKE